MKKIMLFILLLFPIFVKAEDLTDEGIYALGFDDFDEMKQNLDQDWKKRIHENARVDAIELPQLSPALK